METTLKKTLPLALSAFLLSIVASCANPTEVVVFMDTTYGVPCQLNKMRLVLEGDETETVEVDPRLGLQSVTINRASGTEFTMRLEGLNRAGAVISTATANATFETRTSKTVSMVLSPNCEESACDFTNLVENVSSVTRPGEQTRLSCDGIANRYGYQDQTGLIQVINACDLEAAPFEAFERLNNDEVQVTAEALTTQLDSGFDFFFYGERINSIFVSDDGFLHFNDEAQDATLNQVTNVDGITSAGHPQNGILPFWDNLGLRPNGKVCVALSQGAVDVLWVTWEDACFAPACDAGDELFFSVGLQEGSQRVTIGFNTMESDALPNRAQGSQAVLGIIGPEEPGCDASECSAEGLCSDEITPCNFTQVFSNQTQAGTWPSIYTFDPIPDE